MKYLSKLAGRLLFVTCLASSVVACTLWEDEDEKIKEQLLNVL